MSDENNDRLMTRQETADYLKMAKGTLDVWASTKRHDLPYYKVGRNVLYRKSEVDRWLDSRKMSTETDLLG